MTTSNTSKGGWNKKGNTQTMTDRQRELLRKKVFCCPECGGKYWGTVSLAAGTVECHADGCGWTGQRSECGL